MNCAEWEERLALYAGGDLPAGQVAEVEGHLGGCAGCQLFASGLKASLEALREAHSELPAAAHFTAMRSRVLAQLERERRPFWRRVWVLGLATAAAALLVAVAVRPARWIAPPAPVVAMAHPPAPLVAAEDRSLTVAAPMARGRNVRNRPAGDPMLVRMVTDNPDVVIYWITETRGEY